MPIDEQPPVVVEQFPAVDGFAVGRSADLTIRLSDATGIDPASIRLTVGSSGPNAVIASPGCVMSANCAWPVAALGESTMAASMQAARSLDFVFRVGVGMFMP